jgi:hypothetical protein
MNRVIIQTGQGFKAHYRHFRSMRSAWGLRPAPSFVHGWGMRAGDVPVGNNMSVRGARKGHPREMDTTHSTNKAYSSMADTNAKVMLLPAFAGSKQGLGGLLQV